MSESIDPELIRQFEEIGEAQVRAQLGQFRHPVHSAAVRWLAGKERASRSESDALIAEQMRVAASAERAAWIAAKAAIAAAAITIIGTIITFLAWLFPRPG